jgi:predicted DNA repair protein MutK
MAGFMAQLFHYFDKITIMSKAMFSVAIATGYLFTYALLLQFDNALPYAFIMFLFSPVVVIGMVYTVLKYGTYTGPVLGEKEFGYQDKASDELGVF